MTEAELARRRFDTLGTVLALVGAAAFVLLPFATFKVNRIVSGEPRFLFESLPPSLAVGVVAVLGVAAVTAIAAGSARLRLVSACAALVVLLLAIGLTADALTPAGNRMVRVAPGGGFWVVLVVLGLGATDAITRLAPGPLVRVLILALVTATLAAGLRLGLFDHLSIMREYMVNASAFAREARRHVALASGSLAAAIAAGLPLGILCHRRARLRATVLQVLNLVQTIPSIALFGILMVPLGALAVAVPALHALGVSGIGAAPAVVALFLYSLLPVVANTVVGLARVSRAAVDAAEGMGMTRAQVLTGVELPLALPYIITGIRIVLVQNIGLATIAALIGGGGFGTFVFQGVGQTAIDLVLLGAIPTVALAFSSAVVLDALVDVLQKAPR